MIGDAIAALASLQCASHKGLRAGPIFIHRLPA
jgi:hypothetical protein